MKTLIKRNAIRQQETIFSQIRSIKQVSKKWDNSTIEKNVQIEKLEIIQKCWLADRESRLYKLAEGEYKLLDSNLTDYYLLSAKAESASETIPQPKDTDVVLGGIDRTATTSDSEALLQAVRLNTSAVLGSPHRPAATEQLPLLPKVITIEKMTGREQIAEDGTIELNFDFKNCAGKTMYKVRGYAVLVNEKIAKSWRGNFEVYSMKSTAKIVAESIAIAPSFPGRTSQEQEIMRSLLGAIVNEFRVKLYPSSSLLDAANELVKFGWLNTRIEPSRINNLTNQSSSLCRYEFALTEAGKKALAACEQHYEI